DRSIDELNLLKQKLAGCSGCVEIAATPDAFLNQFLAYAHGLEVHSEKIGKTCAPVAAMIPAVNFVQNRIHLDGVVALNIFEAVSPGAELRRVANRCA